MTERSRASGIGYVIYKRCSQATGAK